MRYTKAPARAVSSISLKQAPHLEPSLPLHLWLYVPSHDYTKITNNGLLLSLSPLTFPRASLASLKGAKDSPSLSAHILSRPAAPLPLPSDSEAKNRIAIKTS